MTYIRLELKLERRPSLSEPASVGHVRDIQHVERFYLMLDTL